MEDVLLDANGNFVAAADGDMDTVRDVECLVQDLQHQALTFPGDLWHDPTYGLGLQQFIKSEDTELTRLEIAQTIKLGFEQDTRVEKNSVRVEFLEWELDKIRIRVRFRPNPDALEEPDGIPLEEAAIIISIGQEGMRMDGDTAS